MKIADLRAQSKETSAVLTDANEGIVDALLNLTWQRASGYGPEGELVYGRKPSSKFVSGFLLPRFDEAGVEDETSDIHISTHGLDFQIATDAVGAMEVTPTFSVYVRALPSWEEITAPELDLFPNPPLKKDVNRIVTDETRSRISAMRAEDKGKPPSEKRDIRKIQQDLYKSLLMAHGVRVSDEAIITEDPEPASSIVNDSVVATDGNAAADSSGTGEPVERLVSQKGNYIFETDQAAQLIDVPQKWKRVSIVPPPCVLDLSNPDTFGATAEEWSRALIASINAGVSDWIESDDGCLWAYRPADIRPSNFKSVDTWKDFLARQRTSKPLLAELMPDMSGVRLVVEATPDLRDPERRNIRILLENNGHEVTSRLRERFDNSIHQVSINTILPVPAHRSLMLDRVEPSYRFRDFLSYPAIGVNCGVRTTESAELLHLLTTWMPRYHQPRVVPTEIDGLPTRFDQLGSPTFNPSALRPFIVAYRQWIENERSSLDPTKGARDVEAAERERRIFNEDLAKYESEVCRISLGIHLLEFSYERFTADADSRDAIPYRSWLLLNRTFSSSGAKKGIVSWRLFQMAFILAHIPTLASRMDEFASTQWFDAEFDEETATLLYFPTGGGKSEAFFGLLIFNLFLDRLRGKLLGVTALLRYPLRLLTLQQAQRLLSILMQADLIRRMEGIAGNPFEIGFWVGSGNTPNRADDSRLGPVPTATTGDFGNDDKANADYDEVNQSFNKIPDCPMCKGRTGLRKVKYPNDTVEIAIACFNDECEWNLKTSSQALPFLIVDSDIYRHAPAVVLGVIDKLALIGQHPSTIGKVLGMFGFARWGEIGTSRLVNPSRPALQDGCTAHGCIQLRPAFHNGTEVFVDPYPSLVIQDEAHLLEESLGTFAGLFETLLEELLVRGANLLGDRVARQPFGDRRPRLPKVIAATATVSVPQQQFGALYQRKHMRFPYPGTSIYRSFYSAPAIPNRVERRSLGGDDPMAPELEAPWMRVYVSIMTNGRNHTVTTVSVLATYHLAITELWNDLHDEQRRDKAVARIIENLSGGVLRTFHAEAISQLQKDNFEALLTLVDLMRISLTYVTNKKGGDQVIDAFRDEVVKVHRAHGRNLQQLHTKLISGGVDVAQIQEIMREAEGTQQPGDDFPDLEQSLRNIVATSAISHGVDVDKFNAMFFAGMPNDIAEFIQASSRVGRSYVGFCMLIPTPHARRDRYIVETHDIFHRFLERMIAPPAISRWAASAHDRVLTSMFQAWLCGSVEQTIFFQAPDEAKSRTLTFQTVNDVNQLLVGREFPAAVRDFMDFAVSALGVHGRGLQHIGASPRPEFYEARICNQAKQLIEQFRAEYRTTRLNEYWDGAVIGQRPMTSLRDIDEAGQFVLTRQFNAKRLGGDDEKRVLREALRIVRNQNGRVAELDDDDED